MTRRRVTRVGLGLLMVMLVGGTVGTVAREVTGAGATIAAAESEARITSPQGDFADIASAIAAAAPGDTITVQGGVHPPVVIDKSIALIGEDGATIDGTLADGGATGHGVLVEAADVTVAGFHIQNTGKLLDGEHAGIMVRAPRAHVHDNTMAAVLFGVYLKHAEDSVVERNRIEGYDFESGRRGDGLRAWYSDRAVFRANQVDQTRDVILWFTNDAVVADNVISNGRYGLHFMYDDGMRVEGNEVFDNSVGMFLMYSSNVTVARNYFHDNFGPSGYGLGLKELANITVTDNVMVRNRIGIALDSTPHGVDAFARFQGNLVAFNQAGMSLQPHTKRAEVVGNAFDRNGAQIEVRGSGDLAGNVWTAEDGGNYWSDYVGYDADYDGRGDLPYEPQSLFESLREEHPSLYVFNYGPAAQAVDFAARAVPSLRPSPKVVDDAPLIDATIPAWFSTGEPSLWPWWVTAAGLAGIAAITARAALTTPDGGGLPAAPRPAPGASPIRPPALSIQGVTKRYGKRTVLDGLTLDVQRGESVALWGANGAGKTTAIRSILGLIQHDGEIVINEINRRTSERAARRETGYVPQDQQLSDLPIRDLLVFFADLRQVEPATAMAALTRVGLDAHVEKRPAELSGGLRQRLALALALLGEPSVLLLDEPTANLDAASRRAMLELLHQLRADGVTLLFTTHRADEVIALADRVVTLEDGRVVTDVPVDAFAQASRITTDLMVSVALEDVERTVAVLQAAGLEATARDGWVTVMRVAPHAALRHLWEAGIPVRDSLTGRQQ